MKRKHAVDSVKYSIALKRLARRLCDDLHLDSDEREILADGLGRAWVEGAHLALMEPTSARSVLMGSAEQMQLVREHLRLCVKRIARSEKVKMSASAVRTVTRQWQEEELCMPLYHLAVYGFTGAGFYNS